MASSSSLRRPTAALLLQLQHRARASAGTTTTTTTPAPPLLLLLRCRRLVLQPRWTSSATARGRHGYVDGTRGVVENPPPGMAPVPEDDGPRQTPPRLGEPDPAGPPMPTTSKEKMGGGTADTPAGGGGMPETTPPPDVPVPPVSPGDGRNV